MAFHRLTVCLNSRPRLTARDFFLAKRLENPHERHVRLYITYLQMVLLRAVLLLIAAAVVAGERHLSERVVTEPSILASFCLPFLRARAPLANECLAHCGRCLRGCCAIASPTEWSLPGCTKLTSLCSGQHHSGRACAKGSRILQTEVLTIVWS